MPADPSHSVASGRLPNWACCILGALGTITALVLAAFFFLWSQRGQEEKSRIARWESQVAEVKAGKTTQVLWPEPLCLEQFVRDQPDVAAKITQVMFCEGRISDERFRYLGQFPHLEAIYFDEVWEGADSFLKRIAGMKSIALLSFYETGLTEDGVQAVASFPNLKHLHIHYFWKGVDLKPLRGHKGIESITLEGLLPTKEWIEVLASLPKLREIELEEDGPISTGSNSQSAAVFLLVGKDLRDLLAQGKSLILTGT